MVHGLKKYEEIQGNYPLYKHYCECECGWQTRMATKDLAVSQFNNHLRTHSVSPVVVEEKEEEKEEVVTPKEEKQSGLFNPFRT